MATINKVPRSSYLRLAPVFCAAFLICLSSCGREETSYPAQLPDSESKLPVKVVFVTMFEIGEDLGDAPGEFQFWRERRNLYQNWISHIPITTFFTILTVKFWA